MVRNFIKLANDTVKNFDELEDLERDPSPSPSPENTMIVVNTPMTIIPQLAVLYQNQSKLCCVHALFITLSNLVLAVRYCNTNNVL